jgi:glycosyltransferase involved in cell wall biosynthesis
VIASNAGAHNEIINNNQNGILVDPGDPKMFYLGIIKILNNRNFKKKIVRNALEDCKIFSVKNINSHLIRLYE